MANTRIITEREDLVFSWQGSAYILVAIGARDAETGPQPIDFINVYDAEGKPAIPFTPEALDARVDEWMANEREMVEA